MLYELFFHTILYEKVVSEKPPKWKLEQAIEILKNKKNIENTLVLIFSFSIDAWNFSDDFYNLLM